MITLSQQEARILIPDGKPQEEAFRRITHLGIGAHQDDLEIMAYHGIEACYLRKERRFGGVTCTDGRGSARAGPYSGYTDEDMMSVRIAEQEKAAVLGDYGIMAQLAHASSDVKSSTYTALKDDLVAILSMTRPEVVYTHNPADKHETHIGVLVSTLQAIHELPATERPSRLLGCEVWRGLDWMLDGDKIALDVSRRENLFQSLVGIFDSQVTGGKRYDLATLGRARANATYFQSHGVDEASLVWYAMDLTPLVADQDLDPVVFVGEALKRFTDDVTRKLSKRLGSPSWK